MKRGLKTDVWKASLRDYVNSAINLHESMSKNGYNPDCPIPVDEDGELYNGSHRLACALALGIDEVVVERLPGKVWAPPWDANWFREHEMHEKQIGDLERRLTQLRIGIEETPRVIPEGPFSL